MAAKETVATTLAVMGADIAYIKQDLSEIKGCITGLSGKYITKPEFEPVKKLVYGLAALILIAVIGAITRVVLVK